MLGAGRTHGAPWHSGFFASGTPSLGSVTLTFLRSHGPKSKRSHSGSSRIFPGGRAAGQGGSPGWAGLGAGRARGAGLRAAVGAAGAGSSARGLSAERSGAESAALGAGRGRGRKLGLSRAGGRGGAPRCSNPGRAPRAPSRPAGGTEGDFHRDTPRTRPWLRCEAREGRGAWGAAPQRCQVWARMSSRTGRGALGSGLCARRGRRGQEPRQPRRRARQHQDPAKSIGARRGPFYAPGRGGSRAESGTGAEV